MMTHEPRTLGYYAASHWFQAAVVFLMLGALALVLLRALNEVEEQAERQAVELTLRNMRTGMQLAMGEAMMHQREGEIATWVASNPTRWLGTVPVGYRGVCSTTVNGLGGGEWCFDDDRRVLIYRPHRTEHLRPAKVGETGQCERLSWRVVRGAGKVAQGGFVGLRLETSSHCRWVIE